MIELLKKISLPETLLEPELAKIEKICRSETVAKDTVIFKEGDVGDRCYIIMNARSVSASSSRTSAKRPSRY